MPADTIVLCCLWVRWATWEVAQFEKDSLLDLGPNRPKDLLLLEAPVVDRHLDQNVGSAC